MGGNGHMTGEAWRPDLYSNGSSWVHAWDIRSKIISLIIFIFGVVLLNSLLAVLFSFVLVLFAAASVKIPFSFLVKRAKWVMPFLAFIFAGLILGRGAGSLHDSVYLGSVVGLKALTSITAMILVMGTQTLEEFLKGLSQFRPPKVLVSVLFLCYRYLYLLRDVFWDTYRSLVSRGFSNSFSKQTLRVYGEITGALFLKSLDRSEIVLKSMEARGFDGSVPLQSTRESKIEMKDIIKTAGVITATAFLLWLDWGVV